MDYELFEHLLLANPHLLAAIRAEYGIDCYTDGDEVMDPRLQDEDNIVAYLDIQYDQLIVIPSYKSTHRRLNININQRE